MKRFQKSGVTEPQMTTEQINGRGKNIIYKSQFGEMLLGQIPKET